MPDHRKPIAYRNTNSDIKSVRVDEQKTKTEISKSQSKQHASSTIENEEDGWLTESESEEEASQLEATGGSSSRSTTTTTTSHQSERTNPPVTITSSKAPAPPWGAGKELEPELVALEQWMRHKYGTDDLWPETPQGVPSLAEMRDIIRRNPNASKREIRLGVLGQRTGRSFPDTTDEHVRSRLN